MRKAAKSRWKNYLLGCVSVAWSHGIFVLKVNISKSVTDVIKLMLPCELMANNMMRMLLAVSLFDTVFGDLSVMNKYIDHRHDTTVWCCV